MPMSLTSPLHPIPIPLPSSSSNSNSKPVGVVRAPHRLLLVRSSSGDGTPLRRPSAPTKDKEKEATPSMKPLAPSSDSTPPPTSTSPTTSEFPSPSTPVVMVEFQRQKAKELQEYFRQKKAEEQALESKVFGFAPKNEISNGRWAMFGFAVGLLTEYATGSSFVDQMKIIISNLGIADLE